MGIRFREVARAIEQVGPQTLLVMGCGNGYLESILIPAICTVSVDIDEEDLAVARALNKDKANRDFRLLDLYDLPQVVTAASFEAVVISEVLEHLEDDVKALEVAHYCLASEGTLFLSVPNVRRFQNRPRYILGLKPSYMARDHRREYTLDSILELVRRTGFRCHQVAGLDFWFPKDKLFRLVIPFGSPLRHWVASRWPTLATWYLLVCKKER